MRRQVPPEAKLWQPGGMGAAEAIVQVIEALAWPALVAVLVCLLRAQLAGLAERLEMAELPGGGRARFEVRQTLDELGGSLSRAEEHAQSVLTGTAPDHELTGSSDGFAEEVGTPNGRSHDPSQGLVTEPELASLDEELPRAYSRWTHPSRVNRIQEAVEHNGRHSDITLDLPSFDELYVRYQDPRDTVSEALERVEGMAKQAGIFVGIRDDADAVVPKLAEVDDKAFGSLAPLYFQLKEAGYAACRSRYREDLVRFLNMCRRFCVLLSTLMLPIEVAYNKVRRDLLERELREHRARAEHEESPEDGQNSS